MDFDFGEYKTPDPLASEFDSQPKKKPKESKKAKPKAKPEVKPKVRPEVKPKAKPPVALRTCRVLLEGATVDLVKGQVIEGLTSQELAYLKFHKKVQ